MEEKVLEILEEYCEEAIGYTGDNMMEDGVIDSFTVINVVSDLEEEFDIEFDDGELLFSEMLSMEKICKTIKNHIESKKVAADDE